MKDKILQSFLNDKSIFDRHALFYPGARSDPASNVIAYALILTFHPKIAADIENIRKSLHNPLVSYPKQPTIKSLVKIADSLSTDEVKFRSLKIEVATLMDKYNLPHDWRLPLKVKILTGVLPIPYNFIPIFFLAPDDLDMVVSQGKLKYPCLVITGKVKPYQVSKFINNWWKSWIVPALSNLPKEKFRKLDIHRFALGVWLFNKKEIENKNWQDIDKVITDVEDKEPDYFTATGSAPSKPECQKILDETRQFFNQVYPL